MFTSGSHSVILELKKAESVFDLYHFGGYWRLGPKPIIDNLDIDAMIANLALGAMPEKVSAEDLTF